MWFTCFSLSGILKNFVIIWYVKKVVELRSIIYCIEYSFLIAKKVLLKPPVDQEVEWIPMDTPALPVPQCAVRTIVNSSLIVGSSSNFSGGVSDCWKNNRRALANSFQLLLWLSVVSYWLTTRLNDWSAWVLKTCLRRHLLRSRQFRAVALRFSWEICNWDIPLKLGTGDYPNVSCFHL
jgi:hypothetical protein